MPAKASTRQREIQSVLNGMNSNLRAEYDRIMSWTRDNIRRSIMYHHKLGERVDEIHRKESKFGQAPIPRLAVALGVDQSTLWRARQFAINYSTDEAERLADLRDSEKRPVIYWGHISLLLSIEDKEARNELTQKIIDNSWTVKDLETEMRMLFEKRSRGGRLPVKPKSLRAGLQQMASVFNTVLNRQKHVWTEVLEEATQLPPDEYTEEFLEQLQETEEIQKEILEASQENLEMLQQIREKAQRVLSGHTGNGKTKTKRHRMPVAS